MATDSSPARGRRLALLAALLGWMFDGMEMGLFPLVAKSALGELLGPDSTPKLVNDWYAIVTAAFLIGAATGGVLFGWLGDKIGRVRAMTVSVLVYSLCSGLSGLSDAPWQLAGLRFLGALGMGGEWALGVALVMEAFAGTSRAFLAGLIGAFGNLGYAICALVSMALFQWGRELPTWTGNGHWRLLMAVGAGPAVLTLFIRLFVPESEKWTKEKAAGRAAYWSGGDLVAVLFGAAAAGGVVTVWALELPHAVQAVASLIGLAAVVVGYLYPARQYLLRSGLPADVRRRTLGRMLLAAGLSGVPLLGTWAGLMWMYQWVGDLPGGTDVYARPTLQLVSALTAAVGCVIGAALAQPFGRRAVYAGLCVLSLVTMVGFYRLNDAYTPMFVASAGLLGLITASFYGWLPLYLPELFPTAVRATGQGFGFNFGRIVAAAGGLQMANLLATFGGDFHVAGSVIAGVYLFGLLLITFAPETKGRPLPD